MATSTPSPEAELVDEVLIGDYEQDTYRSATVKVLACETAPDGRTSEGFAGIKTLLSTAVAETGLEGAALRQYDSVASFINLSGADAYQERADGYVRASADGPGADLYQQGGANVWVTEERTTAHPKGYGPSAYTPNYEGSELFQHAWGRTKFAITHELGHLLVNTTDDLPANQEPLSANPFEYECERGDNCHRDHTLATTTSVDGKTGVTIMSRPGNEREHKLGACGSELEGDVQLFYGSDCFHKALDNTMNWSRLLQT